MRTTQRNLIDLHIHILPGVDDGSLDMQQSLDMARLAVESGVHHMAVTPHSMKGIFNNYVSEDLEQRYQSLQKALDDHHIDLQIYHGMEVFATPETPSDLENHRIWTINDTKYFLIEFDFGEDPSFMNEILYQCQEKGYIPIVAHPERYYAVQDDPQLVYAWFCGGCAIQINKGSLFGVYGHREKETAIRLLKHGVVSHVGSDAHNLKRRNPSFEHIYAYLEEYFGKEYCYLLTHDNPSRILRNKDIVGYPPISFDR